MARPKEASKETALLEAFNCASVMLIQAIARRHRAKNRHHDVDGWQQHSTNLANEQKQKQNGPFRGLNPGPPAPEAGIIPLDQTDMSGCVQTFDTKTVSYCNAHA